MSIVMKLETEAGVQDSVLAAAAGSVLEIDFEPKAATVEINQQNTLCVRVAGLFSPPRWNGLTLSQGVAPVLRGSLYLESPDVAKVEVSGTEGVIAIRF